MKTPFAMYLMSRRKSRRVTSSDEPSDFIPLCIEDWQTLSEEEKQKYAEDAELFNECLRRISGDGPSYFTIRDEDVLAAVASRGIVSRIFHNNGDWISQPIVICSFSLYAQVDPGMEYNPVYLPAEVGLTAMTLKNGVIDNFARIIDPGHVPKGYEDEVKQGAKKLGLPNVGTVWELANHKQLVKIITNFLQKYNTERLKGDTFYVFALDSDFLTVRRCLEWLAEKSRNQFPVKVLSLGQYSFLASKYSTRSQVSRGLGMFPDKTFLPRRSEFPFGRVISSHRKLGESLTGVFKYSDQCPETRYGKLSCEESVEAAVKQEENYEKLQETGCAYHAKKSDKDLYTCALNQSNRYAFSILEILTLSIEVPIIAGGHYPEIDKMETEMSRRFGMLRQWGLTEMEEEMELEKPEDQHGAQVEAQAPVLRRSRQDQYRRYQLSRPQRIRGRRPGIDGRPEGLGEELEYVMEVEEDDQNDE